MSGLESLPNELFLFIFCYLHKFDLLYAFTNLNQRFQQIVGPYLHILDLTRGDRSYRHFQLFYEKILPFCARNIQSLKLSGYHHLELFRPHIHRFNNLESLDIENEENKHREYALEQHQFLTEALSLSSLSEITVAFAEENILKTISSSASSNLNQMTLIYSYVHPNVDNVLPMPFIKRFSVNLKSTKTLSTLFALMPNLEEINLSIINFSELEDSLEIPKTLENLQLEFGTYKKWMYKSPPTLQMIKSFTNLFKNLLRSLTLIAINVKDKDFLDFDKFRSIISDFTRIEKFQYNINTTHQPNSLFPNVEQLPDSSYSIFTLPKPQQFDTISSRVTYDSQLHRNLTLQQLINSRILEASSQSSTPTTFQLKKEFLRNLQTIHSDDPIDDFSPEIRQYLAKIIALSPSNLNRIRIRCSGEGTIKICKRLKELIPQGKQHLLHIKHLELSTGMAPETFNYDKRTLITELSAIFPNLKRLELTIEQKSFKDSYETFTQFIDDVRKNFRKLTFLILGMWLRDQTAFEDYYKNQLNKLTMKNLLYHTIVDRDGNNTFYSVNIWL